MYSDFVHTAVVYGRTIISEYFLHEYMKSVRYYSCGDGFNSCCQCVYAAVLFYQLESVLPSCCACCILGGYFFVCFSVERLGFGLP